MRSASPWVFGSLVVALAAGAKEPSYAEKMAIRHMLEYLDEADQVLEKTPLSYFTSTAGANGVEERITKAKQEMTRCPKGAAELATAEERITKLRAAIAAKVEEAKTLAPGAKKVTAGVKKWLEAFATAQEREPLAFQDPNHPTVTGLRADLDALDKQLAAAGNPAHADAQEAAAAITDARAKLQAAVDDQKKAVESLGDWKAKAKALGEKLDGRYVLKVPITDAKVDAWIDLLPESKADFEAAEALKKLVGDSVKGAKETPEYKALSDTLWAEKTQFEQSTTNWYSNFLNDITLANSTKVDFDKLNVGPDGFSYPRGKLQEGLAGAKHKERYLRVFVKDEAGAQEAVAEQKAIEAKLAALEATEMKLLDSVRMPKPGGTPEMQKLLKQVVASKDFVAQMKNEGHTVLRVMVIDSAISHTKTTEWYKGRWYTRDFDFFTCVGAFKNGQSDKAWKWRFDVRFARSELPEIKTGVWTFGSWQRLGPMRVSNVNK